ncbi:MAG: DNA primase [Patescibacteria group bacterium]
MTTPLDEIKSRLDLVDYIRSYVNLSPSGKSLRGLCPFHKEKTPSFFVSPDKQVWYCFGCQKGGDLMKFVMEMERMEFAEALRFLADKAGIVLQKQDPKLLSLKNKVLDILAEASKFYRRSLVKTPEAVKYLNDRGLKNQTINFFQLGFAPGPPAKSWKNLYLHLRQLGFQDNEIEQAGLAVRSEKQELYDRFRNRIMFPIHDFNGRIIGFTARILPNNAETEAAKYINTPETLVYQKNKVLYGFFQTKDEIKNKDQAVLVEGNLDVLMAWQEGLKNVIAVSGTALSEFQLKNLKRFCQNLILSFDMDRAGELATDRSIGLAFQAGFNLEILSLAKGKDLADYAKEYPEKVAEVINSAKQVMEYYFEKIFSEAETDSIETKKKAVAYLLPRIKLLKNPVEQTEWLNKLSLKVKVPEKMLFEEFSQTNSVLEAVPDSDESLPAVGESLFIKSRWERLAEKILGLVLQFPELAPELESAIDYFPFRLQEFARLIVGLGRDKIKNQSFPEELDQSLLDYLILLADYEASLFPEKFSPEQEIKKSLLELKKAKLHSLIAEVSLAIKEAESGSNLGRAELLVKELIELTKKLSEVEVENVV